ncbi:Methyltransferase OMS1, mitochondrial [Pseudocercospora fuligena]|uniref:Methyltransferase OMS1, mitochondrial n=1 Tax=Pseudocercospora fuligena TaxID=685502 RepID=A0A8H6R9H9_9PEZI|nr:Methyltransferase OMS1, mitochondrial [Pseudocercospora fuligena]
MGGIIAFYGANLYVAANQPCQNAQIADIAQQKDVVARYDDTADSFDSEVGFSEWLMGVNKNRKQLAQMCQGHVLEVSCGTGRNLGYYDYKEGGRVESLTFVDISPQMIEVCKRKWMALFQRTRASWFGSGVKHGMSIRFLPASALGSMPLAPTEPPRKYDTIIQTMGLCSTPSPVELLENMVKYLDTGNPESKILLLEHGRSYQEWLNRILDNSAEKHAEIHGCWFNRDVGALVADAAARTGLEVVRERRRHFGTTWLFELRPKIPSAETASTPKVQSEQPEKEQQKPAKRWFGFSDRSNQD